MPLPTNNLQLFPQESELLLQIELPLIEHHLIMFHSMRDINHRPLLEIGLLQKQFISGYGFLQFRCEFVSFILLIEKLLLHLLQFSQLFLY